MARKGNPISVRLDLNRSSDSSWFSDYYYGKFVYQDLNLRSYFGSIRPLTRLTLSIFLRIILRMWGLEDGWLDHLTSNIPNAGCQMMVGGCSSSNPQWALDINHAPREDPGLDQPADQPDADAENRFAFLQMRERENRLRAKLEDMVRLEIANKKDCSIDDYDLRKMDLIFQKVLEVFTPKADLTSVEGRSRAYSNLCTRIDANTWNMADRVRSTVIKAYLFTLLKEED